MLKINKGNVSDDKNLQSLCFGYSFHLFYCHDESSDLCGRGNLGRL